MRTRREQVQAQRFVVRRIVSAMLSANPESLDLPMRRMGLSLLGGLMAAILVATGFWIVGFMFPGGARAWREEAAIVIEEETGTAYVYSGGQLVPMLNFASARLFAGVEAPKISTVHQSSLEGTPRGNPVGIPGAPDAVPGEKLLRHFPWQVCSTIEPNGTTKKTARVVIGAATEPAVDLGDSPILLRTQLIENGAPADKYYVLWRGAAYSVPGGPDALAPLGIAVSDAVSVTPLLLNALTPGAVPLDVSVPGKGRPGAPIGERTTTVGEVFTYAGRLYALMDSGRLRTVGPLAAQMLGWSETRRATHELTQAEADLYIDKSAPQVDGEGFPQELLPTPAKFADSEIAVCGVYVGPTESGPSLYPQVHTSPSGALGPDVLAVAVPGQTGQPGTTPYVWQEGGTGALVRSVTNPANAGGPVFLVVGGVKYGLSPAAVKLLGYGGVEPDPVLSGYLDMVPSGPALDQIAHS